MILSRLSSVERTILLMATIMTAGGIASAVLTTNPDWMSMHLSRLGEGGHLSSYLFNATAAFSGLAMLALSLRISRSEGLAKVGQTASRRAKRVISVAIAAIAVCLVGLAIFPFDKFSAVHNIFGYGMTVVYLIVVAYTAFALPIFNMQFKVAAAIFLATMLGLFVFYFIFNGRQISLLQIQILGLAYFLTWLTGLARAIK